AAAPDEERAQADVEGLKRTLASLEMRLKMVEERDSGSDERASVELSAVKERLGALSEAVEAQDVQSEAIHAALAASRVSLDELREGLGQAEEKVLLLARELAAQVGESKALRETSRDAGAALRDNVAGLKRLLRAAEARLDALELRAGRTEAALQAQQAKPSDPAGLATLAERLEQGLAELAARLGELERRPGPPELFPPRQEPPAPAAQAPGRELEGRAALERSLAVLAERLDNAEAALERGASAAAESERRQADRLEALTSELRSQRAPSERAADSSPAPAARPRYALAAAALGVLAGAGLLLRPAAPPPEPAKPSAELSAALEPAGPQAEAPPPGAPSGAALPEAGAPLPPPGSEAAIEPAPEPARAPKPPARRRTAPAERAATPGVVELRQATLASDGVVLRLTEGAEPQAQSLSDPPRLVLDFSTAPSRLAPRDLGSFPPRIRRVRVRESDSPPRLLWVEVETDQPAQHSLELKGRTLRVRFAPPQNP
ncbi:MAG: AMIN domain-containing protein, partial [Elusimicrobia bacterium]|nr:AMIN domain-containing protein [Elusimicrobiota bacterium]